MSVRGKAKLCPTNRLWNVGEDICFYDHITPALPALGVEAEYPGPAVVTHEAPGVQHLVTR